MIPLRVAELKGLGARAFVTRFARPLGEVDASPLLPWLALDAPAPMTRDDAVKSAVRDLLRTWGYKPTGRGKPASEYLVRAAGEGALGAINAAVDACNGASLHSGLPISVVDLARAEAPYAIDVAKAGDAYVFNASGQTIDLAGLPCLFDAAGSCANAVKDAQRTKTNAETARTLSIVWCPSSVAARGSDVVAWYRELLASVGGETELVL